MHNFKLTWLLLSTLRFQLVLEQERRVSTSGALFFSFIIVFFATFLVTTSNPFIKVPFPSLNSLAELNPVLQDPVLAIHPPCIYAGYVASAICFSLSLAKINSYSSSKSYPYRLLNFSMKTGNLGLVNTSTLRSNNLNLLTFLKNKKEKSEIKQFRQNKKTSNKAVLASLDFLQKVPKGSKRLPGGYSSEDTFTKVTLGYRATFAKATLGYFSKLTRFRRNWNESSRFQRKLTSEGATSLARFGRKLTSGRILKTTKSETDKSATFNIFNLIQVWMLASWSFLTVGILLGSWWAYHELGWGGWWFWDPVENASLMPWLLATACIHMSKSTVDKSKLALILSTFVLSILGTFFVRSGLLASVHSFATDSTRGIYLFLFLLCISILSSVKIVQFAAASKGTCRTQLEQILSLQNFFFCVICFVVFCGTSAPLIFLWFWNRDLSTGAPFYNGTLVPLFTSLFFMLAYTHYAQLLSYDKHEQVSGNPQRLKLESATFADSILRPIQKPKSSFTKVTWRNLTCIILCSFFHFICLKGIGLSILESIYGTICILLISIFILPVTKVTSLLSTKIKSKIQPSRLVAFFMLDKRKSTLAMITAHIGIIIFITGIILSNTFKSQFTQLMHYGSVIRLGSEYCCLRSIDHAYAPTYHSICGNILVTKPTEFASSNRFLQFLGRNLCMFPEKRFFYSNQELTTTKVAIHTNIFTDFYGLIGTGSLETGWYTTIMKLPFIFCIWLGFLLGTVGGVLALKKRLQKSKLRWV